MFDPQQPKVLNVGGNNREIPLPTHFHGWQHLLLDIDPRGEPDLLCDARELESQDAAQFEAIYCSHNLEHYHRHDGARVLAGFRHVLKPGGFAHIAVPDLDAVMRQVVQRSLDVDDVLYTSPAGEILVRDVLYGWSVEIERTGNDFYAHKTGFSVKSLGRMLAECGFDHVYMGAGNLEVQAYAFDTEPSAEYRALLGLG